MAANRFATMLHRNTNKLTLILIYAVLEWILILLLLFNSLFSYLIIKFAEFFGLKPPCSWCTRIGAKNTNRDFICEAHAKEISKLGFCSSHRKLVDCGQATCDDCLSISKSKFERSVNDFGLNNCSCCGACLDDGSHNKNEYSSDQTAAAVDLCDNEEKLEDENLEKMDGADVAVDELKEKEIVEEENLNLITTDKSVQVCVEENEISTQHLEFFLDYSGHRLVPIELIDSVTEELNVKEDDNIENDYENEDREFSVACEVEVDDNNRDLVFESGASGERVGAFLDIDINEVPKYEMIEVEEDENSLVFYAKGSHLVTEEFGDFSVFPLAQWPSEEASEGATREKISDVQTDIVACEEISQANNENEADVSIGTEIPDLDITDEIQIQDSDHSFESSHDDPSTNSATLYEVNDRGPLRIEVVEQTVETQTLLIQDTENITNNQPSVQMEVNEIEEDKVPDTPTSVESLNHLDKKLLLLEKRDSGAEESLDGSVTSELDGGDGVVTIERLKTALRAERKALQVLYSELEEERSASAVATNQTMAMINRLQEEKAAMQMEALQYQRMMEEQSEYDQEALQLLNELMMKREREKQELERELEIYRKKLSDYESKEKMRVLRKSKDGSVRSGFSSASCSNAEDSDGLSVDLNQEVKEEEGFSGNSEYANQNTPVDAVVNLEESLADFEEERLSILEQLKVLEEKLSTLDDEKEQCFEDVKEMDDFHEQNGDYADENSLLVNGEANGHANGFSNGKHHQLRRIGGQKGKSLLPLFDAISEENGDGMMNGNGNESGFEPNGVHDSYETQFEMENKKIAVEEEVDHLYERLQALEADREFLKHCISSLKKGDKGMDLLQEILQHLRDLRNVELRVRNFGDGAIV